MIRNRKNDKKCVNLKYDVTVIGGGIAGVIAAAASAKSGSKTLLVESTPFLGGVVTMGPLEGLMTQYDSTRKIIGGLVDELLELVKEQDCKTGSVRDTTGYCKSIIPYDAESMKLALLAVLERYHVACFLETVLVDAVVKSKKIEKVILQARSGSIEVSAKAFVDCSGSGVLAYYAGCDVMVGDEKGISQPMTVLTKWGNVNREQLRLYVSEHRDEFFTFDQELNLEAEFLHLWGFSKILEKGYKCGALSLKREEMHLMESTVEGEVIINFSRLREDAFNPLAISKAQLEGSRQVVELLRYFRKSIPAFSKAYIIQNSYVGIRESGRVLGRHVLTKEDITERTAWKDSVAMGAFPIDVHSQGSGMRYERILTGYSIPAATLWAEQMDNLFIGGRCLSSTFEANASARISITCMATGQAAGVMASCYQEELTQEDLVKEVQVQLLRQGAIIE